LRITGLFHFLSVLEYANIFQPFVALTRRIVNETELARNNSACDQHFFCAEAKRLF